MVATAKGKRSEASQRLRREIKEHGHIVPQRIPKTLSLSKISTELNVFQPRGSEERGWMIDPLHVQDIASGLGSDTDEPLDVLWTGLRYVLVDGHHRLLAYRQVQAARRKAKGKRRLNVKVPVNVLPFRSTLEDGLVQSIAANSRNKRAMTSDDKFNAAWRMVALRIGSKGEQASRAGVGKATIGRMRVEEAVLRAAGRNSDDLAELTWREAQSAYEDVINPDGLVELEMTAEDWVDLQAEKLAPQYRKLFGRDLSKNPDVHARAMQLANPRAFAHLVLTGAFRDEVESIIQSLGFNPFGEGDEGLPCTNGDAEF